MGPGKIVCSLLFLGLLSQVVCQEMAENSTILCRTQGYLDENGVVTITTQLLQKTEVDSYSICCDGYVYNDRSECNTECPTGLCVVGYCPSDGEHVNCNCYDNWHYPSSEEECIPVCEPSENSECTCHAGYTKDPSTNLCVPTECFDRCTNGQCNQLGTCTCNQNYAEHTDRTGLCVPENCVENCRNGWCDTNGTCNCDKGFKSLDALVCEKIVCPSFDPIDVLFCKSTECESKCNYGACTDNGSCICYKGYKASSDNRFNCQKISCPSHDSGEIEYCKEQCDMYCDNGKCSNSGRCHCLIGYKPSLDDRFDCQQISCSAPESADKLFCKAECDSKCIDGYCSSDGTCNCYIGYKPSTENLFACELTSCPSTESVDNEYCQELCEYKCVNGHCRDDGSCNCITGYKPSRDNHFNCQEISCPSADSEDDEFCEAQCQSKCLNGQCSADGTCDCTIGFKPSSYSRYYCQQISCPSADSEDDEFCKEQCNSKCTNGKCNDKGKCICHTGYKTSPEDSVTCSAITCPSSDYQEAKFCKFQCDYNICINGNCSKEGSCKCITGYKNSPDDSFHCGLISCPSSDPEDNTFCKAQCDSICIDGKCSADGRCNSVCDV